MEAKLVAYRSKKQQEMLLSSQHKDPDKLRLLQEETLVPSTSNKKLKSTPEKPISSSSQIFREPEVLPVSTVSAFDKKLDIAEKVVKFAIWCLLMTLFIQLEFGAVFFVFSVFYLMYKNFRSTPKKPGEISAYSVFNPNCENIDGALTAQQFERELMFRQT